ETAIKNLRKKSVSSLSPARIKKEIIKLGKTPKSRFGLKNSAPKPVAAVKPLNLTSGSAN
ncbi:MAG: hypothetical protein AAB019_11255, partial [Planctomycetota bacterium]